MHGRELHFFVDGGSAHIECTAEDEGETEHIVHLVGMIGAPGGHDQIRANGNGQVVIDFRVWIGHGEHNRIGCHGCNHFRGKDVSSGEPNKYIGAFQCFGQRIGLRFGREEPLILIQVCPVFMQ